MAMDEVLAVVARVLAGEPGAAVELRELWDPAAPAWERCVVAHYAADTETDVGNALHWDRQALAAAGQIDPSEPSPFGFTVAAMLPSLHLNLAENHRRLGDIDSATEHLELGRSHLAELDDDGYGRTIRGGLDRLAARLSDAGPTA